MSLVAGALVGANVRLIRPLKRGGMGSVWLAEHLTLRTQVAVKFMSELLAQDREYVARFSREATASAQIKSPHVVQVFDHGISSDGTPYIVMELLEGEDLRTRLGRLGTISVEETAAIITQVARGLTKAHAAGIVHRDIKPDNIFLTDHDGELFVKLLDFGIAKHAAQESELGMTGTGAMVGTPHYMSPEQILSARRVDLRSDLWSLGVVAYRALTSQVPFQGETLGAVCIAIERGAFVPPSQRRPGLPPSLDPWFHRAFAREVDHRFQTAKEMAEAFVGAAQAGGVALQGTFRADTSGVGLSPSAASSATPAPTPVTRPSGEIGRTPQPFAPAAPFAPGAGALHGALGDPLWAASSAATGPEAHPQTFHGTSITRADWKKSSRRALVTMVSAALGVVVLGAIVIVLVAKRGGDDKPAETAVAAPPSASVVAAPPAPVETAAAQAPPAETAATAPSAVPSASATPAPTTVATTKVGAATRPTSTGRPKRDRGF
ncbi:serine/threonine-protein kinase [Polyangium aurulentum]|uniref:serine/threonine-protein kinase n=1 Tax=Polyangium aurulentum TaxID=2567896 RepID=UPI0010ADDDEA|nr:serine/threonine-protein kinase [Polyangium aurulentum]UQA57932.1 protein kinase [Polyangium aurulentum]